MKDHVEETEHGKSCRHCLSSVDDDGFAVGEPEEFEPVEEGRTEQQASTISMREAAGSSYARALRGYADGGKIPSDTTYESMTDEEKEAVKRPNFNFETMAERSRFSDEYYARKKKLASAGGSGPVGSTR